MNSYIDIQSIDLSAGKIAEYPQLNLRLSGSEILGVNWLGETRVKFPVELDAKFLVHPGLPHGIYVDHLGNLDHFDIDLDDEDSWMYDDVPAEILENYAYIVTSNFTLVTKGEKR